MIKNSHSLRTAQQTFDDKIKLVFRFRLVGANVGNLETISKTFVCSSR